jgi:hypothetical protein
MQSVVEILAVAHLLRTPRLLEDVTRHIISKLLTTETISTFLHVAVEYDLEDLQRACLPIII